MHSNFCLMMDLYQLNSWDTLEAFSMVFNGEGVNAAEEYNPFSQLMYETYENDQPRTNNAVEGFHSALRVSITSIQPNLWKLCAALQKQEALAQTKLLHV